MKIHMKQTRTGSEDGFNLRRYEAGQEYDVADLMGGMFVNRGWAYRVVEAGSDMESLIAELTGGGEAA